MKGLAAAREQLRATVTQLPPSEQQAVAAELKKIKQSRVEHTTNQAERQRSRSADTPPPEERQRQHGDRQSQPYPLDDAAADRSSVEEMLAQAEADIQNFVMALDSAE